MPLIAPPVPLAMAAQGHPDARFQPGGVEGGGAGAAIQHPRGPHRHGATLLLRAPGQISAPGTHQVGPFKAPRMSSHLTRFHSTWCPGTDACRWDPSARCNGLFLSFVAMEERRRVLVCWLAVRWRASQHFLAVPGPYHPARASLPSCTSCAVHPCHLRFALCPLSTPHSHLLFSHSHSIPPFSSNLIF